MTNLLTIKSDYIVQVEETIELPEGYTKEDIKEVFTRWTHLHITMNDGTEFTHENLTQVNKYDDDDAMKYPVRIGLFNSTYDEESEMVDIDFDSGSVVFKDDEVLSHILNHQ